MLDRVLGLLPWSAFVVVRVRQWRPLVMWRTKRSSHGGLLAICAARQSVNEPIW